jgi:ABC-2 type transport system ATP-binding protein
MNEAGYKQLKRKPILYVKNLTKHYFGRKAPAINNISFNVYPGEFHAFIGANGAGKTTTIKCLIGAYYK